ncbi:MAG: hypothetical protein WBX25_24605 [Rhodomicrobium sp.]
MRALSMIVLTLSLASGASSTFFPPAFGQIFERPHRPLIVIGRKHPAQLKGLSDDGVVVDVRDGGTQVVQFGEIWRIRRAFASDEPQNTTVIDFANNRLFVATPLSTLVADVGKKVPLAQFTAPNGDMIYMATGKITDISRSLPGLHNPLSKAVLGTRDGSQQVLEPADAAKQIVSAAHVTP